jgi:hypothetical protein
VGVPERNCNVTDRSHGLKQAPGQQGRGIRGSVPGAGQSVEKDVVLVCNQKSGHDSDRSHKPGGLAVPPLLQPGAPYGVSPKVEGMENVGSGRYYPITNEKEPHPGVV